jgi:hypothetical protein
MAALSDLISVLARTTGRPEAEVFAYGRFAREGGLIGQAGRGRGAARMSTRDAANLVIAMLATDVTREAAGVIPKFRGLTGYAERAAGRGGETLVDWVAPLGMKVDTTPGSSLIKYWLDFNLGTFLEFLIDSARTEKLGEVLRSIELMALTPENIEFAREHPKADVETLLDLGAKSQDQKTTIVGIQSTFALRFDRQDLRVFVEFSRFQHGVGRERLWLLVFQEDFFSDTGDLRVQAEVGVATIAALGWSLEGRELPEQLQSRQDILDLIFEQNTLATIFPKRD